MRRVITCYFFIFSALCAEEALSPKQEMGRYIGIMIAKEFKDGEISLDDIVKGIQEAPDIDIEKCRLKMLELDEKAFKQESHRHLTESIVYLKEIARKEGVIELVPQKLYIERITSQSNGPVLQKSGRFHIICESDKGDCLINTRQGEPVKQDLDMAIKGFCLGVKGMRKGDRRVLYIHPELGYGDTSWVEPNIALKVDVELIDVE